MGKGKGVIIFAAITLLVGILAKFMVSKMYTDAIYQFFYNYYAYPSKPYLPGIPLNLYYALTSLGEPVWRAGFLDWASLAIFIISAILLITGGILIYKER